MWTVSDREITFKYLDERNVERNRTIEISGANILTDDDAADFNTVSKSAVVSYTEKTKQVDAALVGDAGSEVGDTTRLSFRLPDMTKAHFDIVDMKDELFIATTGAGANIVKEYGDLDILVPVENALKDIIDRVLGGDILISDGETPIAYLEGFRLL